MIEVWYLTLCLVGAYFALLKSGGLTMRHGTAEMRSRVGSIEEGAGLSARASTRRYQIRHSVLIVVS
jgi:hypothetical protein